MQRRFVLFSVLASILCTAGYITLAKVARNRGSIFVSAASGNVTQGSLQVVNPEKGLVSLCPLKHTDVKAEISGFLSRVVVTQDFENPFHEPIEAIYTFPLPQNAAVDAMTMTVGGRTVLGRIKRREEARAVYEAARSAGRVAGLLDQERPNIFTQSVANILPGEQVKITISYVETLRYEDGVYEFVFPMVVGPRYIPGAPVGKQGGGREPDTDRVPDASRITPHVAPKGTRAGHDISIEVALDAGVPIDALKTTLHEADIERPSDHSAIVRLKNKSEIPNRDFILKYDAAGRRIEDAVLAHRSDRGGFFTLLLQPPERVIIDDVTPKELVFVLDTSGSMSGFPIEKAKETMKLALDGLYPQDTFNLITFSGDTNILFPEPVSATKENLRKAQEFLSSRSGSGGTEMMKAIRAALDPSDEKDHIRIACFMTDGYVGNDLEIIGEVQKHSNARVFSFGIGSSVNRFLLDKMAEHGRGEVEYVSLSDDGSAAARRFHERIRNPLLTDISVDWSGLPVTDVYPKRIPDLFSARPVVISGRYTAGGRGTIKLRGKMSGRDFVRDIPIDLPENEPRHDVLATLWARTRVDDLMSQDYNGIQFVGPRPEVSEAITQLGIEYRLMTQFTSFVAVEEMTVTDGGKPRRIEVPVDIPEGVSHDGVFGSDRLSASEKGRQSLNQSVSSYAAVALAPAAKPSGSEATVNGARATADKRKSDSRQRVSGGVPGGVAGGVPGGVAGGVGRGNGTGPGAGPGIGVQLVSPEDQKRQQLLSRLHPSIAELLERLKNKNSKPTTDEARFVRDGKAEIQVSLSVKTPQAIAALKRLGFEIVLDPPSSKMVIGRVPLEKLAALAETNLIRYIAPMTSTGN
jgi:Ca-activated chloride channel family protein